MKIYVKTFGCSLNKHDSEVIRGVLVSRGYQLGDLQDSSVVIVNSCGVKQPTENKVVNFIRKLNGKKIIVTGCLPLINLKRIEELQPDAILAPSPGEKILAALDKVLKGGKFVDLQQNTPSLALEKVRLNRVIEIIPVCYGCLGNCSYCCVRLARGKLRSYKVEEIISKIRGALKEGVGEIWLTAQDVGAYGLDIDDNLPHLLREIDGIDGEFKVRVGMINPEHFVKLFDELLDAYRSEKIFKFLHLPIQSGSDFVLKLMNRRYIIEEVEPLILEFVRKLRATFETDIICGFPGEKEDDFLKSLELMERLKPDVVNISRFFPRPNTPAAGMKQILGREVKRRSRKLSEICKQISLSKNSQWIGWEGVALVDEVGKNSTLVCRNFAYKPIVIQGGAELLGNKVHVRVTGATEFYLLGETLKIFKGENS